MGWTGLYYKPANVLAYLASLWEGPAIDGKTYHLRHHKVIRQAIRGMTVYGVVEVLEGSASFKPGFRFATVTLIRYPKCKHPTSDAYVTEFMYKDMDETVGPCETKCPTTLLKLLTSPAYNDHARAWRKACWQHALGLTKSSTVTIARRIWRTNREEAIKILSDWNIAHPGDTITYHS
jgi:hypothetical protein